MAKRRAGLRRVVGTEESRGLVLGRGAEGEVGEDGVRGGLCRFGDVTVELGTEKEGLRGVLLFGTGSRGGIEFMGSGRGWPS